MSRKVPEKFGVRKKKIRLSLLLLIIAFIFILFASIPMLTTTKLHVIEKNESIKLFVYLIGKDFYTKAIKVENLKLQISPPILKFDECVNLRFDGYAILKFDDTTVEDVKEYCVPYSVGVVNVRTTKGLEEYDFLREVGRKRERIFMLRNPTSSDVITELILRDTRCKLKISNFTYTISGMFNKKITLPSQSTLNITFTFI